MDMSSQEVHDFVAKLGLHVEAKMLLNNAVDGPTLTMLSFEDLADAPLLIAGNLARNKILGHVKKMLNDATKDNTDKKDKIDEVTEKIQEKKQSIALRCEDIGLTGITVGNQPPAKAVAELQRQVDQGTIGGIPHFPGGAFDEVLFPEWSRSKTKDVKEKKEGQLTTDFGGIACFLKVHEQWALTTMLVDKSKDGEQLFTLGEYCNYRNVLLELAGSASSSGASLAIVYDEMQRKRWQRSIANADPNFDLAAEMCVVNKDLKEAAASKVKERVEGIKKAQPYLESSGAQNKAMLRPAAESGVRSVKQSCRFWLSNGSCEYGKLCKFAHVGPAAVQESRGDVKRGRRRSPASRSRSWPRRSRSRSGKKERKSNDKKASRKN